MADRPKPSILALGTATFGIPYGVANPATVPSGAAVESMLDRAWAAGISAFDTAPVYGEAEQRLGTWLKRRGLSPHVITKLPALTGVADSSVAKAEGGSQ